MTKTATREKKAVKSTQNGKKASPSNQENTSADVSEKKLRKEQAKREARLMLKLEQAKKGVQKAEQKLTKAQKGHEEALSRRSEFEERIKKLRHPESAGSHNGVAAHPTITTSETALQREETPLSLETPFITKSVDTVDTASTGASTKDVAMPESDVTTATTETPATNVESHKDVPNAAQAHDVQSEENKHQENSPTEQVAEVQIESDGVSMPLLTSNESAWPPPVIREEVAEAAQAETTSATHEENAATLDTTNGE